MHTHFTPPFSIGKGWRGRRLSLIILIKKQREYESHTKADYVETWKERERVGERKTATKRDREMGKLVQRQIGMTRPSYTYTAQCMKEELDREPMPPPLLPRVSQLPSLFLH